MPIKGNASLVKLSYFNVYTRSIHSRQDPLDSLLDTSQLIDLLWKILSLNYLNTYREADSAIAGLNGKPPLDWAVRYVKENARDEVIPDEFVNGIKNGNYLDYSRSGINLPNIHPHSYFEHHKSNCYLTFCVLKIPEKSEIWMVDRDNTALTGNKSVTFRYAYFAYHILF